VHHYLRVRLGVPNAMIKAVALCMGPSRDHEAKGMMVIVRMPCAP
jgi:hypothetical protein